MTVTVNGTTGVSLVQDSTITSAKIVDGTIDQVDMTLAATSIGVGQTWQRITRTSGTTYTNTTGKPIMISINTSCTTSQATQLFLGALLIGAYQGGNASAIPNCVYGIIPNGASYSFTTTGTLNSVVELR